MCALLVTLAFNSCFMFLKKAFTGITNAQTPEVGLTARSQANVTVYALAFPFPSFEVHSRNVFVYYHCHSGKFGNGIKCDMFVQVQTPLTGVGIPVVTGRTPY